MAVLRLVPNRPESEERVRGTRRFRPGVSSLQVVEPPPPAFPSLRPPPTPIADRMLAAQRAAELARPRKSHDFVTDDAFDVGLMRKVKKTWCLNCQQPRGINGVTAKSECTGTRNDKLAAPWGRR